MGSVTEEATSLREKSCPNMDMDEAVDDGSFSDIGSVSWLEMTLFRLVRSLVSPRWIKNARHWFPRRSVKSDHQPIDHFGCITQHYIFYIILATRLFGMKSLCS